MLYSFYSLTIMSQEISIYSKTLDQDRKISMQLPTNYAGSELSYPTIYVFDGNILFDYVVGLYRYNWDLYPPAIIIGIHQVDRPKELGTSKEFTSFFLNELVPFIDKKYRTNTLKTAIGHSFGGAFVLNSCLESAEINTVISISPTVKKKGIDLIKKFKDHQEFSSNKEIYLGYGEQDYPSIMKACDTLHQIIENEHPNRINTRLDIYSQEDHNSSILIGIRKGLKYLYRNLFMPESKWEFLEKKDDPTIFYDHFKELSIFYGGEILAGEDDYNRLGYYYLNSNNIKKSLEIFKNNIRLYPHSSNTYDSFAEALEKANLNQEAISYYKKAIMVEKSTENDLYQLKYLESNYNRALQKSD